MSRFSKTTSIDFQQFGEVFSETTEKNALSEHRKYITVSSHHSDHLYKATNNTCFRVKEGIAAVAVTENLETKPRAYVIHRVCRLYSGTYYCFLSISDKAKIEVTSLSTKQYAVEDFSVTPIRSSIQVNQILGDYFVVRGPHYVFPGETHQFWEITYVDTGKLFTRIDDREFVVGAHQMLLYAPNQHHSQYTADFTCSYLTVVFDMDIQKENAELLKNKVFDVSQKEADLLSNFNKLKNTDSIFSADLSTSLIQLFIVSILAGESKKNSCNHINTIMQTKYQNELLGEIALYIQENIYTPITVKDICYKYAISRSLLQGLFKNNLGITPKQYITDLKFFKAKQMIKESSYSISEIARICGFSSIHYFSRDFKKRYGFTPTEYAKSIGE